MIEYFEGTVFNTDAGAIVNTVNCEGYMGAGIALEYSLRYPEMYQDYQKKCKEKKIKTGFVDYYLYNNITIVNFPTKNLYKFPSNIRWIKEGLINFVETYKNYNITSVAFPKLGTSNGGLNWEEVKNIMEYYLKDIDAKVYICLDKIKEPAGKEKQMLDSINKISIQEISHYVKLTEKQKLSLQKHIPYQRFWQISQTQSIGKTTYKNLFKHFYEQNYTQTKLF